MIGDFVSIGIALVVVPVIVIVWLIAAHNVRVWRIQRTYRSLPPGTRDRVLQRIHEAGRHFPACTLLVAEEVETPESGGRDVVASRFGGQPYAEVGDAWPLCEEGGDKPAEFLIQVRLDSPLPPPWAGRLVVVFSKFDPDQTVRVYKAPSAEKFTPLSGGPSPQREWRLRPVAIPKPIRVESSDEEAVEDNPRFGGDLLDYDPVVLFETVGGLQDELVPCARRPADLLAILLAPNHYGYEFGISDVVQLGGRPAWLQEDPGPIKCEQCGRPMRFLFQFGDLNGGVMLGDAGVCYVFGCDDHPNATVGTVQMC